MSALTDELKRAAVELGRNPSAKPLREIKKVLEVERAQGNNAMVLLNFFLGSYIDLVLFNIAGFVKWVDGKTETLQTELLRKIGVELGRISELLNNEGGSGLNSAELIPIYESLSRIYIDTIAALNDVYKKR